MPPSAGKNYDPLLRAMENQGVSPSTLYFMPVSKSRGLKDAEHIDSEFTLNPIVLAGRYIYPVPFSP